MFSYIFSIEPNFRISFFAVTGPTPSTPGTLSELSPINPSKSIICSGPTPHFSDTFCALKISFSLLLACGAYSRVLSLINCIKSLSPLTILHCKSSFSHILATVPIISSASTPSIRSTGIFIPSKSSHKYGS